MAGMYPAFPLPRRTALAALDTTSRQQKPRFTLFAADPAKGPIGSVWRTFSVQPAQISVSCRDNFANNVLITYAACGSSKLYDFDNGNANDGRARHLGA
jgi:hypothetical protein